MGLGFRVEGLGFRVEGLGLRVVRRPNHPNLFLLGFRSKLISCHSL